MSLLYTTGPVGIYAAVGGTQDQRQPLFLGWGEKAPQIEEIANYNDVICDIGGGKTPFDQMIDGIICRVSVELMRYNESVILACQDRSLALVGASLPGLMDPGQLGSLMVAEGLCYELWLNFPYAAKPYNIGADAEVPGYHFFKAKLENDVIQPGSSTPKKIRATWLCLRYFDVTVTNAFGAGRLSCFDFDLSAIAAVAMD